jgi:threonine efflux protein
MRHHMLTNHLLHTYFPNALPLLLFALMSPGPDFFIVTGHAIRGRFKGSVFICMGICLANAVYIIIAMLGWSALTQQQSLLMTMKLIGAMYLLYLGYTLTKSKKTHLNGSAIIHNMPYPQQLFTGFTSAILNPKNILFYFSLTGLLLGEELTTIHKIITSSCMILMVLLYNLLLIKLITLPTFTQLFQRHLHYFERLAGCILILISLLILNAEIQ